MGEPMSEEKKYAYKVEWTVNDQAGVVLNFSLKTNYKIFLSKQKADEFYEQLLDAKNLLKVYCYLNYVTLEIE